MELSVMEQRYQAVLAVVRDGWTVTDVAEKWGVSRQSVHAWLARYRDGGLEALADRSHRPKRCPHQVAVGVEARLCEMRGRHPGWGPRRLAYELAKAGVEVVPSRSSIYRALVRNGLIEPKARQRRRRDYKRWERARPMELWQIDVVGGVEIDGAGEHKVVTGVDDHSRFCVMAGIVERATARAVCGVFADALQRWGVPDEVLTDNGKVFTNRLGPKPTEVLFDRICRDNAITHRLTAVRSPTTTGKIERFHRTLRVEFLTAHSPTSPTRKPNSTAGSTNTTRSGPTKPSTWTPRTIGSRSGPRPRRNFRQRPKLSRCHHRCRSLMGNGSNGSSPGRASSASITERSPSDANTPTPSSTAA